MRASQKITAVVPIDPNTELNALLVKLRSSVAGADFVRESPEPNVEECRELRSQLLQLAAAARTAGLLTYSSLSLRVAEELQPHVAMGSIPDTVAKLLLLWPRASLRYLRRREHVIRAEELIKLLDVAMGVRRFGRIEREVLMSDLTELLDQRQSEAFTRVGSSGTLPKQ